MMSATALTESRATRVRSIPLPNATVVRALVISRLIIIATGALATIQGSRFRGWQAFDPSLTSSALSPIANALTATAVRWDAIHYLDIARSGYQSASDAVFFPLYPVLIHAVSWLTGSLVSAGLLVSLSSFALALLLLHRLTVLEFGPRAADATVVLIAVAPLSLFFSAVYSESLFLLLSVGAIYAARRDCWPLAAVLAALAAVTRVPGILVAVAVLLLLRGQGIRSWQSRAALALAPLTLVGFCGYLAARGFGWLAPIAGQLTLTHMHVLVGPFAALGFATGALLDGVRGVLGGAPLLHATLGGPFSRGFQSIVLFGELVGAGVALVAAFRRLPRAYGVYALLVLLACLTSPQLMQPLEGLDRYLLVVFPLWMVAGNWLAERRGALVLAGLASTALMIFYAYEFAAWAFLG